MAEFYKYKARGTEADVDFTKPSAAISKNLIERQADRTKRRFAMDESDRLLQKDMNEVPLGQDEAMNQSTLNMSQQVKDASMEIKRLTKKGLISESENHRRMQLLNDNVGSSLGMMKEFQDKAQRKLERANSNDIKNSSQSLEGFMMADAEQLGRFKDSQWIVDPATGVMGLVRTKLNKKTGQREPVKGSFKSSDQVRKGISTDYDQFDLANATNTFVKSVGEFKEETVDILSQLDGYHTFTTITDPTLKKVLSPDQKELVNQYELFENQFISDKLEEPLTLSSILTESLKTSPSGKAYDYTFDAAEAKKGDNLILLEYVDGVATPVFDDRNPNTKSIKDQATKYLRNQVRGQLDREIGVDQVKSKDFKTFAPNRGNGNDGDDDGVDTNAARNAVGHIYDGTPQQLLAGINDLKSMNDQIIDVKVNKTTGIVKIIYSPSEDKIDAYKAMSDTEKAKVGYPKNVMRPFDMTKYSRENFVKAATNAFLPAKYQIRNWSKIYPATVRGDDNSEYKPSARDGQTEQDLEVTTKGVVKKKAPKKKKPKKKDERGAIVKFFSGLLN